MTALRSRSAVAAAWFAMIAVLVVLPSLVGNQAYRLQTFDYILALTMVAIGLNIVTGYAGQLSLGPGAIFAFGGYAAAVLADHYPRVGLIGMCLVGIAIAAVAGLVIGVPALRVGGFYLGMTTLFFALLVPIVATNLSLTGRATGISLLANPGFVPRLTGTRLYEVTLAVTVALVVASWALLRSRMGRRFLVLAASEELAASLGIAGYRTKLLAFVVSALPAGIGGAFYAYSQQFMSPGSVTPTISIYLLAACVIGGFGTVPGPFIGGLLVVGLSQYLGRFQQYQGVIYGALLIAFAVAMRDGLVGFLAGPSRVRILLPWLRRPTLLPDTGDDVAMTTPSTSHGPPTPPPGSDAGPVLEVRGAARSFGGVRAVDDVDLDVRAGTVHGLIGSNGSGKTTLLNLISGFHHLDAGSIRLRGQPVVGHGPWRTARAGVARTFQTPILLETETVLDNVIPAAEAAVRGSDLTSLLRLPAGRRTHRVARDLARDSLERVGLQRLAGERAGAQPHGIRRLVELARALSTQPHLLLLDEPAAGLSARELDVLRQLLDDVVATGTGVLLVEHNIPLVRDVAADLSVLHEGRLIARGGADVLGNPEVAAAFLGPNAVSAGGPSHPPTVSPQ